MLLKIKENTIEVVSSIGASVSLTCLVEPLPQLEKVVWTKGNRKIIPNSEYTIDSGDQQVKIDSNVESSPHLNSKKSNSNIKVKFESLSLFGVKQGVGASYYDAEDDGYSSSMLQQAIVGSNKNVGGDELIEGVTSTDSQKTMGLLKSVLTIRNVRKQDFGVYRCKASNAYGNRRVIIVLREKSLMGINSYYYIKTEFLIQLLNEFFNYRSFFRNLILKINIFLTSLKFH